MNVHFLVSAEVGKLQLYSSVMSRIIFVWFVMICDVKAGNFLLKQYQETVIMDIPLPLFLPKVCHQIHCLHNLYKVKYIQQHIQI